MKKLYWALVATFAAGLALANSPAHAQPNATCTGTLAAGTYNNVNVPPNAACTVAAGVTVEGNVTVAAGASLTVATTFPTIVGNVQATGAAGVELFGATVDGNVVLTGTGGSGVFIESTFIGGHLSVSNTTMGLLAIIFNDLSGNVLVASNTPTASFSNTMSPTVAGNMIGGNLVCTGNTPAANDVVTTPDANTVTGNKVGECAGL